MRVDAIITLILCMQIYACVVTLNQRLHLID